MMTLLWRLARAYPAHGMVVLVVASLLAIVALAPDEVADRRRCQLAQDWAAGTAYDNQDLELHRRGNGVWRQSDRHGEQARTSFRWTQRGSALTFAFDGQRRTVAFEIERRGDTCVLRFDGPPLPRSFLQFYGVVRPSRSTAP